jgi:hypothetical protein
MLELGCVCGGIRTPKVQCTHAGNLDVSWTQVVLNPLSASTALLSLAIELCPLALYFHSMYRLLVDS